jgi:hypothetical protein
MLTDSSDVTSQLFSLKEGKIIKRIAAGIYSKLFFVSVLIIYFAMFV